MPKFLIKCSFLLLLLFLGVLIGMEKANQGMIQMKGYEDKSLSPAIHVEETNNGNVEASVLGEKMSSHNLEEKKEHLQKIKGFNLFSSLGKSLTAIISFVTEKLISVFSSFL